MEKNSNWMDRVTELLASVSFTSVVFTLGKRRKLFMAKSKFPADNDFLSVQLREADRA